MWRDISRRATRVVALAGIAAFQPLAAQEPVDTTKQPVDTTKKQPVVLEPLEVTAAREHAAPPPVATINLTGAVLVALNARALGPYTPIGEPDIRTQPYIVFDLSGQVPLGAGLQLDLAIQNLFDTKYPEIRASGFINP